MNATLTANPIEVPSSSEPLAELVRQMLAADTRPAVKPRPRPRQPEPVVILSAVREPEGNFLRSTLPVAVMAVLVYLLMLAV
jgi:hypothetical protein